MSLNADDSHNTNSEEKAQDVQPTSIKRKEPSESTITTSLDSKTKRVLKTIVQNVSQDILIPTGKKIDIESFYALLQSKRNNISFEEKLYCFNYYHSITPRNLSLVQSKMKTKNTVQVHQHTTNSTAQITIYSPNPTFCLPSNCEIFLQDYHISHPLTNEEIERVMQGKNLVVFCDIENIHFSCTKPIQNALIICAYSGKINNHVSLNKSFIDMAQNKK
jgi:hypothetical protein